MPAVSVDLVCYGGTPPGSSAVELATANVDLGSPQSFFAWTTIGYINGLSSPWDFDNAVVAEIFLVDGVEVPIDTFGAKLGPLGDPNNLHQIAFAGFGQVITFRLRVFQPEEMEVEARGIVLTGI